MRGDALKAAHLHLKTVTHGEKQTLAQYQAGSAGPTHQIGFFETEPEIPAGVHRPTLVVAAQIGDHQHAAFVQLPGRCLQGSGGRGQVVQHHIDHHRVDLG